MHIQPYTHRIEHAQEFFAERRQLVLDVGWNHWIDNARNDTIALHFTECNGEGFLGDADCFVNFVVAFRLVTELIYNADNPFAGNQLKEHLGFNGLGFGTGGVAGHCKYID